MPRSPVIAAKPCFATTPTGTWSPKIRGELTHPVPHQPRFQRSTDDDIRSPRTICAHLARLAAHTLSRAPGLVNDRQVLFLVAPKGIRTPQYTDHGTRSMERNIRILRYTHIKTECLNQCHLLSDDVTFHHFLGNPWSTATVRNTPLPASLVGGCFVSKEKTAEGAG